MRQIKNESIISLSLGTIDCHSPLYIDFARYVANSDFLEPVSKSNHEAWEVRQT